MSSGSQRWAEITISRNAAQLWEKAAAFMGYPFSARVSQSSERDTPSTVSLAHLSMAGFIGLFRFVVVLVRGSVRESVIFRSPCRRYVFKQSVIYVP